MMENISSTVIARIFLCFRIQMQLLRVSRRMNVFAKASNSRISVKTKVCTHWQFALVGVHPERRRKVRRRTREMRTRKLRFSTEIFISRASRQHDGKRVD